MNRSQLNLVSFLELNLPPSKMITELHNFPLRRVTKMCYLISPINLGLFSGTGAKREPPRNTNRTNEHLLSNNKLDNKRFCAVIKIFTPNNSNCTTSIRHNSYHNDCNKFLTLTVSW
jgi:hypothetical protein